MLNEFCECMRVCVCRECGAREREKWWKREIWKNAEHFERGRSVFGVWKAENCVCWIKPSNYRFKVVRWKLLVQNNRVLFTADVVADDDDAGGVRSWIFIYWMRPWKFNVHLFILDFFVFFSFPYTLILFQF